MALFTIFSVTILAFVANPVGEEPVVEEPPTYMNEATSPNAALSRRQTAAARGKSIPPQMEFGRGKPPVHEPRSPKSPFLRRPASVAKGATPRPENAALRPASSYQSLNMSGIINLAESVNKKIREFRDTIKDGSKTLARKPKEPPKRPPRRKDRLRLSAAFSTLPKNFKSSSRDLDVIEEDQIQLQATSQQEEQRQEQGSELLPEPRIPQPGSSAAAAELAKSRSQGDIGGGGSVVCGPSPSRLIPSIAMPGSPESSVTLSAPSHTPCAMSSLASPSPLDINGAVR